jgi:hypothetical protein
MYRLITTSLSVCVTSALLLAQAAQTDAALRRDYPVIELRRYTIKQGKREDFVRRFESFFPEAIQQTGAIVAGEFLERANRSMFTWIRAFHDLDDRARLNAALYYGPVWKEHRSRMNEILEDSDHVLLLHPLDRQRSLAILPAVDPAKETLGSQGIVVTQIFPLKIHGLKRFAEQAGASFAGYRAAGAREAGAPATLDVPNNVPPLPIRTDGEYLVWFGVLKDNEAVERRLVPLAAEAAKSLMSTGLLRGAPELVILDPAPRSRMRWLPGC